MLLNCLDLGKACPLKDYDRDHYAIVDEIARRGKVPLLIAEYRNSGPDEQAAIVAAMYNIRTPQVKKFMQEIAFRNLPDGQDVEPYFYPLAYLAHDCDARALARLNRRVNFDKSFPTGCILFAPLVQDFGKCNYRAAAPNLALALNAACLNITDAAYDALHKWYPQACTKVKFNELESCFLKVTAGSNNSVAR
jgi:hypothetical protein